MIFFQLSSFDYSNILLPNDKYKGKTGKAQKLGKKEGGIQIIATLFLWLSFTKSYAL